MPRTSSPPPPKTAGRPPGEGEADAARALPGEATPRWLRPAVVRLVLMLAVFVAITSVVSAANKAVLGSEELALGVGVLTSALALWLYAVAVRITERRRAVEVPLALSSWSGLLRGLGVGLLLFTVTLAIIGEIGDYRILESGTVIGAATTFGLMCLVATTEEILFRGLLFRIVEELTGTWGALVISSVLFGFMHMLNPHATIWGATAIAIEAGLMLGIMYAATRTLWLPIGFHLGWNTAQSGIFGMTGSGADLGTKSLLEVTVSGPVLLTGGDFGPEASVVSIAVCTVSTVIFLRLAQRRGRIYGRRRRSGTPQAS